MSGKQFCAWSAASVSVVHSLLLFASLSLAELGERVSVMKARGPHTEEERDLVALYEAAKGSERIDFQDLLLRTTQLLTDHPAWRAQYQRLYSHVLIDEAQDLDPLQARFLSLFVDQALTVFLDPDQAIYAYAGAEPYTTLDLLGTRTPRTTIALRPSYRSRAPILASALRLIAHNPNGQHARTLTPMRPGRLSPRWYRVASPAAEARLTAETIALLLQRGTAPDGHPLPVPCQCLSHDAGDRTGTPRDPVSAAARIAGTTADVSGV